jgi:hypothetical protein
MKKPYFLRLVATVAFMFVAFFGMNSIAHADVDVAVPLDQKINTNLDAVPSKKIDIQFTKSTITQNDAQFEISLTPTENTPTILVVTVLDPGNNKIIQEIVFSRTVLTRGDNRKITIRNFSNLKAGTTYTIQLTDTAQSSSSVIRYQKLSFTTAGDSPYETNEPKDVQQASFSIVPDDPVVTLETGGSNENYKATFTGKFTSTLNMRTNLQLFLGEKQSDMVVRGTLFKNSVVPKDTEQSYSFEIYNLKPKTTYWYKIYESTKGFDAQGAKSFDTPLDGSALESTEDPSVQKAAISVTMDAPVFNEIKTKAGVTTSVDVTLSGKVVTTLNTRVGLVVWFGLSSNSIFKAGNVLLSQRLIFKGVDKKFSQTLRGLQPGTKYYYNVQETTKDFFTNANSLSFTTPGAAPTTATFDPDAPGVFGDYEFNTNLGEPTGDGSSTITEPDVLVPCGKRSDQTSEKDKNCKFEHLLELFTRIIDYMLVLLVPLTALVAIYTGVQMIIHRGMPAELTKYKDNLIRIGWGVAVMLLAWTIIATLLKTFVDPSMTGYILLDLL